MELNIQPFSPYLMSRTFAFNDQGIIFNSSAPIWLLLGMRLWIVTVKAPHISLIQVHGWDGNCLPSTYISTFVTDVHVVHTSNSKHDF